MYSYKTKNICSTKLFFFNVYTKQFNLVNNFRYLIFATLLLFLVILYTSLGKIKYFLIILFSLDLIQICYIDNKNLCMYKKLVFMSLSKYKRKKGICLWKINNCLTKFIIFVYTHYSSNTFCYWIFATLLLFLVILYSSWGE